MFSVLQKYVLSTHMRYHLTHIIRSSRFTDRQQQRYSSHTSKSVRQRASIASSEAEDDFGKDSAAFHSLYSPFAEQWHTKAKDMPQEHLEAASLLTVNSSPRPYFQAINTNRKERFTSKIQDSQSSRLAISATIAHRSPSSRGRRSESFQKRTVRGCELVTLEQIQHSADVNHAGKQQSSQNKGSTSSKASKLYTPPNDTNHRKIRIIDVDRLSTAELHTLLLHTLVHHVPAELALKVISRIGVYRDTPTSIQYHNLLSGILSVITAPVAPALLGLLCRAYATISIPLMVDYIRRYGKFSKQFIAKKVSKSMQPRLFDFVRYENRGGVPRIAGIVTQPWALTSYTELMKDCSAKKEMYNQLKLHASGEATAAGYAGMLEETVDGYDKLLPPSLVMAEKLLFQTKSTEKLSQELNTESDSFVVDKEKVGMEALEEPRGKLEESHIVSDNDSLVMDSTFSMQYMRVEPDNILRSNSSREREGLLKRRDALFNGMYTSHAQRIAETERLAKEAYLLNRKGSFVYNKKRYYINESGEWKEAELKEEWVGPRRRRKHRLIRKRRLQKNHAIALLKAQHLSTLNKGQKTE